MFRLLSDFAGILILFVIALGAIGCTRQVSQQVFLD